MKSWRIALASMFLGSAVSGLAFLPFALHGQAAGGGPGAAAIPKELTSYRDVVKKVLPSVVSIEARTKASKPSRRRAGPGFDELEPDDTPEIGFGSGFLVDPKGVILTNYHVVEDADALSIELQDGRKFTSKDVKSDPKSDLAIVRIEAKEPLPYLELGDSDAMEIGDRVLAVGAPFRLRGTVTAGIVSSKGRSLHLNKYEDFIQTDAAINPGNSGGPLVNLEGKVVGIDSAIKSETGGFQGVGLAIASNLARDIMGQLLKDGRVRRGYLGVQIKDLADRELAARLGAEGGGVLVTQVFDDGPAAKAGVKDGDILTELAGKAIRDTGDLMNRVASLPLGKSAAMTVVHDGSPKALAVAVEEQPRQYGDKRVTVPRLPRDLDNLVGVEKIGVEATDLTPDLAKKLGFKDEAGALIMRTESDGVAADAGLARGMVVTRLDKKPVKSAVEFRDLIDKAALEKGVVVRTYSAQGVGYVLLKRRATEK